MKLNGLLHVLRALARVHGEHVDAVPCIQSKHTPNVTALSIPTTKYILHDELVQTPTFRTITPHSRARSQTAVTEPFAWMAAEPISFASRARTARPMGRACGKASEINNAARLVTNVAHGGLPTYLVKSQGL